MGTNSTNMSYTRSAYGYRTGFGAPVSPYQAGYGFGPAGYAYETETFKAMREAEEKAYKEHVEAERKAYEDAVAAEKKAFEDERKRYEEYVSAQEKAAKEAQEAEYEMMKKAAELDWAYGGYAGYGYGAQGPLSPAHYGSAARFAAGPYSPAAYGARFAPAGYGYAAPDPYCYGAYPGYACHTSSQKEETKQ